MPRHFPALRTRGGPLLLLAFLGRVYQASIPLPRARHDRHFWMLQSLPLLALPASFLPLPHVSCSPPIPPPRLPH